MLLHLMLLKIHMNMTSEIIKDSSESQTRETGDSANLIT